MEITVEEMRRLSPEDYILIDMRNEQTRDYGVIPGALPVSQEELESKEKQLLAERLEQAKAEVGELARSEEQAAEKKLEEAKTANDAAVRRMEALYQEKGAQWVQELVRRALEA